MARVKKNDTVMVIVGDDRGKTGKVLRVDPEGQRVLVEGVNYVWRHLRRSQQHPRGARIQKEMQIDLSNVAVVCQSCGKPAKIQAKRLDTGEKVRLCKKCHQAVNPQE